MPKHAISAALYEELTDKLDQAMDERDDVAEKKGRVTRALGGHLKVLDNQIARLRRQRKGLESPQQEIPGTEAGEQKRDPAVEILLRAAEGLPEKSEKEPVPAEPGLPPIEWTQDGDGALVADVQPGRFEIIKLGDRYSLFLRHGGKRVGIGSPSTTLDEAKEEAARYLLEVCADGMLPKELTKKSLRGGPIARKKRGRRG